MTGQACEREGALERIGPGCFVAVCGPSGAGKDSLLRHARALLHGNAQVAFPNRTITRMSDAAEEHATATDEEFDRLLACGGFAVSWRAHGLRYGIPVSIDADIGAGRCVVCNVSRTVIADLRARYARVLVVSITAPQDVLAARLRQRGRDSDGNLSDRIARSAIIDRAIDVDLVIENTGTIDEGARKLCDAIGSRLPAYSAHEGS